jgi:hypothetical protein
LAVGVGLISIMKVYTHTHPPTSTSTPCSFHWLYFVCKVNHKTAACILYSRFYPGLWSSIFFAHLFRHVLLVSPVQYSCPSLNSLCSFDLIWSLINCTRFFVWILFSFIVKTTNALININSVEKREYDHNNNKEEYCVFIYLNSWPWSVMESKLFT